MKGKAIYLAGPMTGHPNHNYPAFNEVAESLRKRGATVMSPAEMDVESGKPWAYYMRKALPLLCQADIVAVLPKWENSLGASLEVLIACVLGMEVIDARSLKELYPKAPLFRMSLSLVARNMVRRRGEEAHARDTGNQANFTRNRTANPNH